MKNNDLISVVIPTYGRSSSLIESIKSVINQTYSNLEIIVVDDNNPDSIDRRETENIMKNLMKNEKRIKYIKHKKNTNGAVARNTGIKKSRGAYVAFLDDDDAFYPNKIEKQYQYLKNNKKYKCVGCGYMQNGKQHNNVYSGNLSKEILTLDYCFTTSMLFFERKALLEIGCFDERFVRHQDYELLLKYFRKYEIGYLNEILLTKGINSGENIPTGKKAERTKKLFLSTFEDVINEINIENQGFKKRVFFNNYFELFKNELKGKHFILAIKYFCKCLFLNPFLFIKEIVKKMRNE